MPTFMKGQSERDANARPSYEPLPKADYPLALSSWENKPTRTGQMIAACFIVLEGDYADKKFYFNYNYENANQKTVEIAGDQMKNLVVACGEDGDLDVDTEMLDAITMRRFVGRVDVEKAKPDSGYDDSNRLLSAWAEDEYFQGLKDGTIKPVAAAKSTGSTSAPPPKTSGAGSGKPPPAPKTSKAPPPAPAKSSASPPQSDDNAEQEEGEPASPWN